MNYKSAAKEQPKIDEGLSKKYHFDRSDDVLVNFYRDEYETAYFDYKFKCWRKANTHEPLKSVSLWSEFEKLPF